MSISTSRYLGLRIGERDAVISGIGRSVVGRKLGRTGLSLTVEAALQAIEDAGLSRDDIDGLSTYPGLMDASPGMSPCGIGDVQDALRLKLNWYSGGGEVPAQLGAVFKFEHRLSFQGRPLYLQQVAQFKAPRAIQIILQAALTELKFRG